MPELKKQDYLKRDFNTIRDDIEQVLKIYFPEQWQDFNVASAGMALVDLLAYVSDLLSYYTDKRFNELFLDGVSERASAYRLAKTLGYKVPGIKASSTLVDITINVPPTATGPNQSYLPVYRPGIRLEGAGQIFETVKEVDFSSDYDNDGGNPNRIIEPIFDANQNISSYRITKRELATAGVSRVQKIEIGELEASTPFNEIILPENNIIEILDIILKPGINILESPTFTDFKNFDIKYYEVEHLADNKVFLDDTGVSENGFRSGNWTVVNRRFTKEYLSDGRCKLTFGGGTPDVDAYQEYLSNLAIDYSGGINYKKILDNKSLGEKLQSNSTLYIKYRIGGGEASNVGARVINRVTNIDAIIYGTNPATNESVISSTQATNIIPALGGRNLPSTSEIRYAASSNFAAQERCVTLDDYVNRVKQLPGRFGAPFRVSGRVNDNKIQLYIISKNAQGVLSEVSSSLMKQNMIDYLERYRMINDYIEINDAKVVNLQFEIDLFTDKSFNQNEIKTAALEQIREYFNVENWEMNQNIYISQLTDIIREIPGVINVIDIRAYNLDGGPYSNTLISQADSTTTEFVNISFPDRIVNGFGTTSGVRRTLINYIDNAIFSTPLSIFEVRFPEVDLKIRVA